MRTIICGQLEAHLGSSAAVVATFSGTAWLLIDAVACDSSCDFIRNS